VTGPTGDIGRAFLRACDRSRAVARVLGMARRPFDPAARGLRKTEYRQGDVLDREAVDALAAEADVVVHLAFIIMGGREESRRINLEGSGNVFAAAAAAPRVRRLVYTSSVAAYGFYSDNPRPLTEAVPPRGRGCRPAGTLPCAARTRRGRTAGAPSRARARWRVSGRRRAGTRGRCRRSGR